MGASPTLPRGSSPALALWRAPTDNDRIGRFAAAWQDAGIDRLERRLVSLERDGDTATIVDAVTTGGRDRHPARARSWSPARTAAFAVTESVTIPDSIADLARVGIALEVVPGLEPSSGSGAGRTRRTRTASAAGSSAAGARPSPSSTCRTSDPRRTAAMPTSAGWSSTDADGAGVRLELDRPGQVSVHAPPRRRTSPTATHELELVPHAETVVHLDAAHRGLGTAAAGRTPCPSTSSVPGTYTLDAGASDRSPPEPVTIEWRADDRQFHLTNGRLSLVLRVFEDGRSASSISAPALPLGRSYRHLGPDPFDGFANRVGESVPLAYPTAGTGDFRVPALVVRAPDGATALALRYRRPRASAAGKPALEGLPSTYVEADAEAETLTVTLRRRGGRHRGRRPVHDLPRPRRHRPERHDPRDGRGRRRAADAR